MTYDSTHDESPGVRNDRKLAALGFRPVLVLRWKNQPGTFRISPLEEDLRIFTVRSVIYAWYDRHRDVVMNIGQTKGTLKARFLSGYERWLNGLDAKRDRPIRHEWLNYIYTSKSGLIEIHVQECDSAVLAKAEDRFMNQLEPRLNMRRKG